MAIHKSVKVLVAEATAQVETLEVAEAIAVAERPDVLLVDLRDIRERQREGFVPGSFHAPRGMLEFWVDPESPYHHEVFAEDRLFLFYCASGWRSALATKAVQEMGLSRVAHVGGGFDAWRRAGGPVVTTKDGREARA